MTLELSGRPLADVQRIVSAIAVMVPAVNAGNESGRKQP